MADKRQPRLLVGNTVSLPQLGEIALPIRAITLWISPPDNRVQIHVETVVAAQFDTIVEELRRWCFSREDIRIEDSSLSTFALELARQHGGGRLQLGPDVHQVVELPSELTATVEEAWPTRDINNIPESILAVAYRQVGGSSPVNPHSLRVPTELNHFKGTIGAHGRGVTVLGGHDPYDVNTFILTASQLLFALARVRDVRNEARSSLAERYETTPKYQELSARHDNLVRLTGRLRGYQLRLANDVDAPIDGLQIPELVVDSYRDSLTEALRLREYVRTTDRLIERLSSVSEADRDDIELRLDEARAIGQGRWATGVALLTSISLPFALLFPYFAIADKSALSDSLIPWLIALAMFLIIVFGARRIRRLNRRDLLMGEPDQ
jgi:hypothetical protein